MMNVREKVVRALECCTTMDELGFPSCGKCPYDDDGTCPDLDALHKDALGLIRSLWEDVDGAKSCKTCRYADYRYCDPDADYESAAYRRFASCKGSSKLNWKWRLDDD